MGVKKNNKPFGGLIIMLLWVLVPFLAVRSCTSKSESQVKATEPVVTETSSEEQTQTVNLSDYTVSNDGSYAKTYSQDSKGLYELTGPVMDVAHILSESEYYQLNSFLLNLSEKTGAQIVVLTVPKLNGLAIETFSIEHATKWELGQKGVDNGVLLTVAMQEHDIRIETGYGAEGSLTDAKCARIIRNVIAPAFQQGKYGEGIISAVENMAGILQDDPSLVTISEEETDATPALIAMGVFFVFMVIMIILAATHSKAGFAGGPRVTSIPTSMFNSSFGSSSGGFSFHGGGGSFGGGGASGRW